MSTIIDSAANVVFAASDPVGTVKKSEIYARVTQPEEEAAEFTAQASHPNGVSDPVTRTITHQGGQVAPTLAVTSTDARTNVTVDPPTQVIGQPDYYKFNVFFEKIA